MGKTIVDGKPTLLPGPLEEKGNFGAYYIKGYIQGALLHGFSPRFILDKANISPNVYHDPEARVTGVEMQRLILTLREIMDDHYLGFLQVRGKLAMNTQSGLAAVKGEALGGAIWQFVDFINAVRVDEERQYTIDEKSGEVALLYRFFGFNKAVNIHLLYLYRMYWAYKFYCWLIGHKIRLRKVHFSGLKPDDSIDYNDVFCCPVFFNQAENKLIFDKSFLSYPIIRSEDEMYNQSFINDYNNWFTIPGDDQRFSSQVEQILVKLHAQKLSSASIEIVAGKLSMSSRTLTRKLAKEKISYQMIKSKVRYDMAIKWLLDTDLSVTKIASKVGYSEPGDFTRAFSSWAGLTPSAYRAVHSIQK